MGTLNEICIKPQQPDCHAVRGTELQGCHVTEEHLKVQRRFSRNVNSTMQPISGSTCGCRV